jgi:hypothetical protein
VGALHIVEQSRPGEEEPSDELVAERKGLPDAWIHDGNKWALVIESKIESPLSIDQLYRHARTAEKRGFTNVHMFAFVTEFPKRSPPNVTIRKWTQLYCWLLQQPRSEWGNRLTAYMEVLETRMVADEYLKEGTLTVFAGIPFGSDYPYNYPEAKRLLRLALNQLRERKDLVRELGMNPSGRGRSAITGLVGLRVWDFLPLSHAKTAKNFTNYPHLTVSIQPEQVIAIVTIPNGIQSKFRRNLISGGHEAFCLLFAKILGNLNEAIGKVNGAAPWIEILQRHYPNQRSEPKIDAELQFDLRTAFKVHNARTKAVKHQAQWLDAAYAALSQKQSNLQLGVGATFRYAQCVEVNSAKILDRIAGVWLACKPLIRTMLD